ncbi:branched chain amino acid aminotransferase, partial [Halomonas elongata]|nr:branched chain amino acid aminotransferase [Halomonas elongata]
MPTERFSVLPSTDAKAAHIRDDILANPGFGRYFTDHMAHVRWTADAGWHGHEVRPYGPLTLDPAAAVLH